VPVLGAVGGAVGEVAGLPLGVAAPLEVTPPLGLVVPLSDGLTLPVVVLLVLPPGDEAGAVVVTVVLGGELCGVCVTDVCAGGDVHWLREGCTATVALLDGVACTTDVDGEGVPCPSVVPAALDGLLLVMSKAELMASPTDTIPFRAAGTADRTTPIANTAAPMAKAGRSMASRQSRCGRGVSLRPAG